ncbi:hypothetical protein LTR64_007287 [Lithohypha guttulata]|uniref:uncharacterized protein n=1 Tax=Lithohypha guttulata TaxID=1690604 RepID=UPI002DDFF94A|nr:hypothetical protein LTR51_004157 [Lithohypha guttulata]
MRRSTLLSFANASVLLLLVLFCHVHTAFSAEEETQYVTYTNLDGETLYLDVNREPSLYTKQYGDCQGDSVISVTRFDAAYYKDNMTITFNLGGYTQVANESVIMYIGVYAYGENRFNLTFDPCFANIHTDVAGIPELALSIPDFEGQAILRIFGNSTQSQIACYSAVLTNGNSFSHPTAIGSTVGFFVVLAFAASVATAMYGQHLQETRKHYAHSVSILVVFSVLQHVFFTGALSMNFPSVLVAFWSNFGWASGMIYSSSVQRSIDQFIGNDRGNISSIGAPASGETAVNLGGGYSLSSIYRRNLPSLQQRAVANTTTGFSWYGTEVAAGLPLPGNYSSFAGTLSELHIPASAAFLTGLIWFLVLLALLGGAVLCLKIVLELFAAAKLIKTVRLAFFRAHWIYCAAILILRTCYVGFFVMTFLSLFQISIGGGSGPLAIAAIVFCLFLLAVVGISIYAVWYRLSGQQLQNEPDKLQLRTKPIGWTRATKTQEPNDERRTIVSLPWRHIYFKDTLERPHVHDDDDYLIKFGWLSGRFRRSKWWFFSAWLIYELVRACFYGGAAGSPLIQVFGLLAWEILSLLIVFLVRPFESNRLNMLMVYLLGFSKVVSVALCVAFDPRFGLGRILTTVIGIVIIVIQGVLIICMLIAIVIGSVSSWMSLRRYHEEFHPSSLTKTRTKYFAHIDQKASDKPLVKSPKARPSATTEELKEPYFAVSTVRRQTKIEDDDPENKSFFEDDATTMGGNNRHSMVPSTRPGSVKSRTSVPTLPYGARRHRASWSTRDFSQAGYEAEHIPSGMHSRMSLESMRDANRDSTGMPARKRGSSVRHSWTNDPSLVDIASAGVESPPNSYQTRHVKSQSVSQNQLQARYMNEEEQERQRPTTSRH